MVTLNLSLSNSIEYRKLESIISFLNRTMLFVLKDNKDGFDMESFKMNIDYPSVKINKKDF